MVLLIEMGIVRPVQQPTFVEAAQESLRQPVFTVSLKANSPGIFNLGHVDHSLYQGDLVTAPVNNSEASWVVDTITLSAGNATVTQQMLFGVCLK